MIKVYLDRGEGKELAKQVQTIVNFDILAKKGGPVAK
jgi:hypothetical protein